MDSTSTRISYRDTKAFSGIILDYLAQEEKLSGFYQHPPTLEGIHRAIESRKDFSTNREVLVSALKKQYEGLTVSVETEKNISLLIKPTSFTITTAHQPVIFTGPLYFIYKILHAIRLAENCKTIYPEYDFIPVYYMGSEDADLDELGHYHLEGEKHTWDTRQTGAVGRMKVDKSLLQLIEQAHGQLAVHPHGEELITLIKKCYVQGALIQNATFALLNELFGAYGLVVLIPDNAALKSLLIPVFKDDLLHQTAAGIVEKTADKLKRAGYKVQANPREINLFYLSDDKRERIQPAGKNWEVVNEGLTFSEDEILSTLQQNPEKFSPNVILRGLYQETILPNIVFIGGGGETAYWLQLKDLFTHYQVPFPVLVLRNSFLVIEKKWEEKLNDLGFSPTQLFEGSENLLNQLVIRDSQQKVKLNGVLTATEQLYETIKDQAVSIDPTLEKHVSALKTQTVFRLHELEKKMLRAEKRKFNDQKRQIEFIRQQLFPHDGLQERINNFMPYYAKWGKTFFQELYRHSLNLEQEFVIITTTGD